MKKAIIKFFDRIIILILGFSGLLYSCAKYGTIVSYIYEIKGVVTEKETSKPIQNIQLSGSVHNQVDSRSIGEIYTNANGEYMYSGIIESLRNEQQELILKIDDIDGVENGGKFISKEVDVIFTKNDQVKKEKGKLVKTINIELTKREIDIPLYGTFPATFEE